MITNRLTILLAVLLGGLSTVFLLPKQLFYQPVGVNLTLPESVGVWEGKDEQITEKEIGTLGPETQFARKTYTNGLGDELHVTIVLSDGAGLGSGGFRIGAGAAGIGRRHGSHPAA
jgi:hypothetical protein